VHVLDVTSAAVVRLLIIAAILAIPVLLAVAWRSGRRWRLVVAELVNSTGDPKLDGVAAGLTQLARQRIDIEIGRVSERRDLVRAVLSGVPGFTGIPGSPDPGVQGGARRAGIPARLRRDARRSGSPPARVQRRLDDSWVKLLSAARDVAPQQAQPAVQLLILLVSRPRGLMVAGIMQRRGDIAVPRFGVTFDVLHLDGSTSVASQTFWEPEAEPGHHGGPGGAAAHDRSPQERLLGLFGVAARWVAIQLVVHTVFPHGASRRERGLDKVLLGTLMLQSVTVYPPHAAVFRLRAKQALGEAAGLLARSPKPRPHLLAGLADGLDQLAAAEADPATRPRPGQPDGYARAHAAYAQAIAAIERLRPPDPGLLRRYQVRQAICWLASAQSGPCGQAISWLSGPDMTAPKPETATDRYDLACLYALASEVPTAADAHPDWRATAARYLVRALACDLPAKTLWLAAAQDPQLRVLHSALPGFTAAITKRLASAGASAGDRDPAGTGTAGGADLDVEEIVAQAFPVG
jgi:hypothetical protein